MHGGPQWHRSGRLGQIELEERATHAAGDVDRADLLEAEASVVVVERVVGAPAVEPDPVVAACACLLGDGVEHR
jgi:hypothetical protein